jgi:hypothetical protein
MSVLDCTALGSGDSTHAVVPAVSQVYSANEERDIKVAKNAADTAKRQQVAEGNKVRTEIQYLVRISRTFCTRESVSRACLQELEDLERKAQAIYRTLWNVSKFKRQLEEVKDEDRVRPSPPFTLSVL